MAPPLKQRKVSDYFNSQPQPAPSTSGSSSSTSRRGGGPLKYWWSTTGLQRAYGSGTPETIWAMNPVPREESEEQHRYLRTRVGVQPREWKGEWSELNKVLQSERKAANILVPDAGVAMTKKLFYGLARPNTSTDDNDELPDSQPFVITPESQLTIQNKENPLPLTQQERDRALNEIRTKAVIPIPEKDGWTLVWNNGKLAIRMPEVHKKYYCICTHPECFDYHGTLAGEVQPKCYRHKGEKIGFVVAEYTDSENEEALVLCHHITSFAYCRDADKIALSSLALTRVVRSAGYAGDDARTSWPTLWPTYQEERKQAKKPVTLHQIRSTLLDDEGEATKLFISYQSVTAMKLELGGFTTKRINYLNKMIAFPNGAELEVMLEMQLCGMTLFVSCSIPRSERGGIPFPFGTENVNGSTLLQLARPNDIGALYAVANPHILYFGKSESGKNTHISKNKGDTIIQYSEMDGAVGWDTIPLGSCPRKDLEKNEGHLHMANMFIHLLKFRQPFVSTDPPYEYKYNDPEEKKVKKNPSHPVCWNKQTKTQFIDDESMGKVNNFVKKYCGFGFYLGPEM